MKSFSKYAAAFENLECRAFIKMENGENLRLISNDELEGGFNHYLKEMGPGYQRCWLGAFMLAIYC